MVKNLEPGDHLYDEKLFLERSEQVSGGQARDVYSPDPPTLAVACLPWRICNRQTPAICGYG